MFRERYVNSILGQEIGWFDTCGAGELSTKVASLSGQVQDGLGRKVGELFQYASQIVSSFVIGFYLSWELTVILIASFPIIGAAGAFMINAVTEATNKSHEQYAGAGGLASESLGAIRTVTAFNMQTDIITKYRGFLIDAMNVGILKGTKIGLGNGLVFGCAFLTYALGFWYGARLVADYLEDGCTNTSSSDNCLTGGTILAVFFSVLIGSMALGQLAPPVTAVFAAKAAVGGIMEIVDRKPLIDGFSKEGMQPSEKVKGKYIVLCLTFNYCLCLNRVSFVLDLYFFSINNSMHRLQSRRN